MQDQKILRKAKSGTSPKEYQVPMYRNSTCWHTLTFECSFLSYNFPIIRIHTVSFFLKHEDSKGIEQGRWPRTLWIQTLPYWGVTMRASFSGEWTILCAPWESSLPGTTKANLASLLHAAHWWQEMPLKDPKVWLAVKLGLRGRTFQERLLGTLVGAISQKQAQSDCLLRPRASSSMVAS